MCRQNDIVREYRVRKEDDFCTADLARSDPHAGNQVHTQVRPASLNLQDFRVILIFIKVLFVPCSPKGFLHQTDWPEELLNLPPYPIEGLTHRQLGVNGIKYADFQKFHCTLSNSSRRSIL